MTKIVYGWAVYVPQWNRPLAIDLFFSSRERFYELWNGTGVEQLVEITVPEGFDDLDYIPDNY